MNTQEHIKHIYDILKNYGTRLTGARQVGGVHNLLGIVHPDTDPASPPGVGSIIRGSGGNEWEELDLGAAGEVLTVAGGNVAWQPGGGGGGGVFEDNFDDGSIHWAWTTLLTGATRTITEAGGVLTMHSDSGVSCDFWTTGNDGPQIHIGSPNFPHTIVTKVDHDGAVPNLCEFGIFGCCRVYTGVANGCWIFGRRRWDASGQNGLFASRWGTALANVDPLTTLPIWLRLRIGGGQRIRSTCYFDYSTDGINWTNLTSDSNSGMYPSTYGFTNGVYIRTWAAPYPQIDAEFDLFTMTLEEGPG